jgi:hypothetical protein
LDGRREGRASELAPPGQKRRTGLIGRRDEQEGSEEGVRASQSIRASSSSSSRVHERGRITKPSRRGGRAGGRSRGGSRAAGLGRLSSTPTPSNIDFGIDIGVHDFGVQAQHREHDYTHHEHTHTHEEEQGLDVPTAVSHLNEQDLDLELDPTAASIVGLAFGPDEAYASGR